MGLTHAPLDIAARNTDGVANQPITAQLDAKLNTVAVRHNLHRLPVDIQSLKIGLVAFLVIRDMLAQIHNVVLNMAGVVHLRTTVERAVSQNLVPALQVVQASLLRSQAAKRTVDMATSLRQWMPRMWMHQNESLNGCLFGTQVYVTQSLRLRFNN